MTKSKYGLSQWHIFAGGTGAAEGKHAYQITINDRTYSISLHTTKFGRHAGYFLSVFPSKERSLHSGIDRLGNEVGTNSARANYKTPQMAASAAQRHAGVKR